MAPLWLLLALLGAVFGIGMVGALAGLVLGNLRLPLLLLVVAPAQAAGTNMAISASGAVSGVLAHRSSGHFDQQAFLWMLPTSLLGAFVGGMLASRLPGAWLVLLIAALLVPQGLSMALGRTPGVASRITTKGRMRLAYLLSGLGIGLLGGIVGLVLGSIRLPVMLRLGIDVRDSVATNLAVGSAVGVAGVAGHLVTGSVDLTLALLLTPAAIVGALLGVRMMERLTDRRLHQAIGLILLAIGLLLAAQTLRTW